LQLLQVGQYILGVLGHVGDHVHPTDDTCVVDQKRMTSWILRVLLVRRPQNVVGGPDLSVDITEQRVPEELRLGEVEGLRRRVEGGTENDAVGSSKAIGAVTQRLSLDRSTGGRGLRIPPQQHPSAAEVGEAYIEAVLVG
jgi:hypothetical protein